MSHKRKRTAFSINQKQEIICYQDKHPNASHQTIADHFATVWGVEVKRRTVGDIIQQRDKWLSLGQLEPAAKRQKTAKHTDLEQALWLWFSNFRAQNGVVTDDILRAKAKQFGAELGISISPTQMDGYTASSKDTTFPVTPYVGRVPVLILNSSLMVRPVGQLQCVITSSKMCSIWMRLAFSTE